MAMRFLSPLLDILYPADAGCTLCRRGSEILCDDCADQMASMIYHHAPHALSPLRAITATMGYTPQTQRLVYRMKYDGAQSLAEPLAQWMAQRLEVLLWPRDLVLTPVPLYRRKLYSRGFNQAQLLAEHICRVLRRPAPQNLLTRRVDTLSQSSLDREQRADNVRNAFGLAKGAQAAGKRILLIDDIHTTGATAQQCAKVLLEAGAREVYALTLAGDNRYGDW